MHNREWYKCFCASGYELETVRRWTETIAKLRVGKNPPYNHYTSLLLLFYVLGDSQRIFVAENKKLAMWKGRYQPTESVVEMALEGTRTLSTMKNGTHVKVQSVNSRNFWYSNSGNW